MKLHALVRRRLGLTTVGSLVTNGVLVVTLALTLVLAGRGSTLLATPPLRSLACSS